MGLNKLGTNVYKSTKSTSLFYQQYFSEGIRDEIIPNRKRCSIRLPSCFMRNSLVILRQLLISRPGVYGVCQSMYLQTSLPNITQIMLTLVFFVDFLGDMEC